MIKTVRIIVKYKNKILFLQKASNSKFPNAWEFPGGKIEKNDSEISTAVKELREETGISLAEKDFVTLPFAKEYSYFVNNKRFDRKVIYFLTELKELPEIEINKTFIKHNISEDKHQAYRWFSLNQIFKIEIISQNSIIDFQTLLSQ